jgi:transglutaminase-like putative cysteine protease
MIRLTFAIELRYDVADQPADFVFNIHAACTPWQTVVIERLVIEPPSEYALHAEPVLGNRYLRLRAGPGPVVVRYEATVDINHHRESPEFLPEVPIARIPPQVLPFIYPSRYCQSDRLRDFAMREFGHLHQGCGRVQAIHDWVRSRTAFRPGSSNSSTSAVDTLVEQAGVCRDFAHLMIALCRTLNIPARFVTSIDYGAAPVLGAPDFHAFVEVFLGDRWYSFDPTGISPPMGLVRIGTGRDAADVSFATIFGAVRSQAPVITITALDDPANGYEVPHPCAQALSTSCPSTGAALPDNPSRPAPLLPVV